MITIWGDVAFVGSYKTCTGWRCLLSYSSMRNGLVTKAMKNFHLESPSVLNELVHCSRRAWTFVALALGVTTSIFLGGLVMNSCLAASLRTFACCFPKPIPVLIVSCSLEGGVSVGILLSLPDEVVSLWGPEPEVVVPASLQNWASEFSFPIQGPHSWQELLATFFLPTYHYSVGYCLHWLLGWLPIRKKKKRVELRCKEKW